MIPFFFHRYVHFVIAGPEEAEEPSGGKKILRLIRIR